MTPATRRRESGADAADLSRERYRSACSAIVSVYIFLSFLRRRNLRYAYCDLRLQSNPETGPQYIQSDFSSKLNNLFFKLNVFNLKWRYLIYVIVQPIGKNKVRRTAPVHIYGSLFAVRKVIVRLFDGQFSL